MIDHEPNEKSQWLATEPLGNSLGKTELKGVSLTHESSQEAILLPFPNLKVVDASTFNYDLQMLIQRLVKHFPFPFQKKRL